MYYVFHCIIRVIIVNGRHCGVDYILYKCKKTVVYTYVNGE